MAKTRSEVQEEIDLLNIMAGRLPGRGARNFIAPLMRINAVIREQMATAVDDASPIGGDGGEATGDESESESHGRKRGRKSS